MSDPSLIVAGAITSTANVFVLHPQDIIERLPCVVVTPTGGGGGTVALRAQYRVSGFSLEAWDSTPIAANARLNAAIDDLTLAWRTGADIDGLGSMTIVNIDSEPAPADSGVTGVGRSQSTCNIHFRLT